MIPVIEDMVRSDVMSALRDVAGEPVLEFRGVSFGYTAGRPVLKDVDLVVDRGEFVAVAGPNGGGKTTLLRLALGLEEPAAGTVKLFGDPAQRCRRRAEIGYVAQRTSLGGEAPATVRELVAAGRLAGAGLLGPLRGVDRGLVDRAVARVGLAERARAPLRTLSGGMQQRAFIAKALAAEPSLLILDEPTTGVDAASQDSLAALLDELRRELGVTIVYVSHEFGAVEEYVERLVLVRGGIVFDGSPHDLPGIWHDPSHVHA
jgi:zinc transport system ATP-binding protein